MPRTLEEIFVVDLRRVDGSRFVTSANRVSGIAEATVRHKGVAGQVSHWQRTGQVGHEGHPDTWQHPMDGWVLNERFPL